MTAGYSGTPLVKKLGIVDGSRVAAVNAPASYEKMLSPMPPDAVVVYDDSGIAEADIVHLFTNSRDELFSALANYKSLIKPNGAIWVSWYKKAARLATEITEDTIRDAALPLGLVDIKVCAVDERWSALKLVIRRENR